MIAPMGRRHPLSLVHRVRPASRAPVGSERPPLLILLHGVGGNELAMAALAAGFDPRFIVISARSPIELSPYAFGWYSIARTPSGPAVDPSEVEAAWTRAITFVDEAVAAYAADPQRVFLAGFSQGGIIALGLILLAPGRIAGAVSMSGWFPPEVVPEVMLALAPDDHAAEKPVLIVHGMADSEIEVAAGRSSATTLRRFGLAVDYAEFAMGHTTTDESLAAVQAWLSARLDARPDDPS
jgi:phospholipase/carboxylesterase